MTIDGRSRAPAPGPSFHPVHLTAKGKDTYAGGTVWTRVHGHSKWCNGDAVPASHRAIRPGAACHSCCPLLFSYLRVNPASYIPAPHCRYYLENLPQFLTCPANTTSPSKDRSPGWLEMRLPGEQDPNRGGNGDRGAGDYRRYPREEPHPCLRAYFPLPERPLTCSTIHCQSRSRSRRRESAGRLPEHTCRQLQVRAHRAVPSVVASGGLGIADEIAFNDNEIQHADYGPIM